MHLVFLVATAVVCVALQQADNEVMTSKNYFDGLDLWIKRLRALEKARLEEFNEIRDNPKFKHDVNMTNYVSTMSQLHFLFTKQRQAVQNLVKLLKTDDSTESMVPGAFAVLDKLQGKDEMLSSKVDENMKSVSLDLFKDEQHLRLDDQLRLSYEALWEIDTILMKSRGSQKG